MKKIWRWNLIIKLAIKFFPYIQPFAQKDANFLENIFNTPLTMETSKYILVVDAILLLKNFRTQTKRNN